MKKIIGNPSQKNKDLINLINKTKINHYYIKNYEEDVEFFLSATIYVNENETMNDNIYEYDNRGIPFLAEFSRQIYQFEKLRKH